MPLLGITYMLQGVLWTTSTAIDCVGDSCYKGFVEFNRTGPSFLEGRWNSLKTSLSGIAAPFNGTLLSDRP